MISLIDECNGDKSYRLDVYGWNTKHIKVSKYGATNSKFVINAGIPITLVTDKNGSGQYTYNPKTSGKVMTRDWTIPENYIIVPDLEFTIAAFKWIHIEFPVLIDNSQGIIMRSEFLIRY